MSNKVARVGKTPCDKCKTATHRTHIRVWGKKWLCGKCIIEDKKNNK